MLSEPRSAGVPARGSESTDPSNASVSAPTLRDWVALLRVNHWIKNVFVFGGLLFGGYLGVPTKWLTGVGAFALFCLAASATYIDNDLVDREADRQHPRKRWRPLAAGTISPERARVLQAALILVALVGGLAFNPAVAGVLAVYLVLNAAYTRVLKNLVVLDVMVIAVGFVLRVLAGCVAVAVEPSVWILLCTFLLALFLGLGKRRHELILADAGMTGHRVVLERYSILFLDQMIVVVSALTLTCYIMYTVWPDTIERHGTTKLVYTVPLVLYGLFRYDFLVYREEGGGSPTELVLTDRPLLLTLIVWALVCAGILYSR